MLLYEHGGIFKSLKLLSKVGAFEKLKNWYTPGVGSYPKNKAILEFQKENIVWDSKFRSRYKRFVIIVASILILTIFIMGIYQKETVPQLLSRICFVLPVLKWCLTSAKKLSDDICRLDKLQQLVRREQTDIDTFMRIQKGIFEHRGSCYLIPEKFYWLFKDKDEKSAERLADIDKE